MGTITPILPKGATVVMPERFKCPLCGRKPKCKGFSNHLNRCLQEHEMTRDEYEKIHQDKLYSPAHQFAVKWFNLADFSIYDFGLMDYAGKVWCHIKSANPRPWYYSPWRRPETCPLLRFDDGETNLKKSFWHFKKHLRGDLTLGIWPHMDNRFTMIDLDDEDVAYRDALTDRLVDLRLCSYLVFSGKKGYQVWIFWDKALPHEDLLQLQSFLCEDIPHDTNVWPYKRSLIKLPLGLHRGTRHLACLVDENGVPFELDEQLKYFLQIRGNRVPEAFYWWRDRVVFPVVDQKQNKRTPRMENQVPIKCAPPERLASRDPKALEHCLNERTKLQEGRHHTLFLLALHLKQDKHLALERAQEALEAWSSDVESKHGLNERLRDARSTVRRVYEGDMVFSCVSMSELSEEERAVVYEVCEVCISVYGALGAETRPEDVTKRTNSAQKVALVMAAMHKSQGGCFSVGERKLAQLAGISRWTVRRALAVLVEDPAMEMPQDLEDYDPVIWDYDKRPRRHGGMFVCERRGSFPSYRKSVFRLTDEVLGRLGWSVGGQELAARECVRPAVSCRISSSSPTTRSIAGSSL